jgi:hypothetical protein
MAGLEYGHSELAGGVLGGAASGLGTAMALSAIPGVGIPLGIAMAGLQIYDAISGYGKRKSLYKRTKKTARKAHYRTQEQLAIKRAIMKERTRGGQKGIGGGHMVGRDVGAGERAGTPGAPGLAGAPGGLSTVQDIAMGRTLRMGELEKQAEFDRYYQWRAQHRAQKSGGGAAVTPLLNVLKVFGESLKSANATAAATQGATSAWETGKSMVPRW